VVGPSDQELVQRFQAGDQGAFVTLMERHERRIYNLAYRLLGRPEDARDACQDAFLSCYRHLPTFRGDSAFTTWMHRVTVNACYDILRKRPPTTSLEQEQETYEPAASPDHAEAAVAAADVHRALQVIPVEFRTVLVMHEVQDLPLDEISAALEIPIGTVKSRLHRGRIALGKVLAGEPAAVPAPSKPESP
jgi:RNA polymerase sigma-70 factor (ECF subfamily)